jgi:hypothetical protein
MANPNRNLKLARTHRQSGKLTILLLVLLAICSLGRPAEAEYGDGSDTAVSVETSTYVFVPDQSVVVQTGGIAGVHETYGIEGKFHMTVDFDVGIASFDKVDANLTEPSGFLYTQSLGVLFNMTELAGAVVNDSVIEFKGKTADDTNTDILINLTFLGDWIHLTGETIPPPGSADFFEYNLAAVAWKKYGGGAGEPNDPYLIYTTEQMNAIGAEPNDWDKHFKLMADIDLSSLTGAEFNIIGYGNSWNSYLNKPFTGVYDGNGHTISHFNHTSSREHNFGLFGYVDDPNAVVRGLGLVNPNISVKRGSCIGTLIGRLDDGLVTNCYVEGGSIDGDDQVSGLIGFNGGTIMNCYTTCSVSGTNTVGGLVGSNSDTIVDCSTTGSVTGGHTVGGLVASNYRSDYDGGRESIHRSYGTGIIAKCYSAASVKGTDLSVGGLVGTNAAIITNCHISGSVVGVDRVGGLVGTNACNSGGWGDLFRGEISNCYSTAAVQGTGESIGGIVGKDCTPYKDEPATITNCYWNIETSSLSNMCGNKSESKNCDNSYGKTTAEMMRQSTFQDWDFIKVWNIGEKQTYPYLRVHPAGDLNHDNKVDFKDFAIMASHWLEQR